MKKIYIAIPSHDNRCHFGMTFGLLELYGVLSMRGIAMHPALHAKTSAARGRNNLISDFLDTDADALFFIDTDVLIKGHAQQLVNLALRDKAIVGGLYPHKTKELRWCLNTIPGEEPILQGPDAGLMKVDKIGTGLLRIKREAIEHMIKTFPEVAYTDDDPNSNGKTRYALCQETVVHDPQFGKPRWMTDDWYFCYLARKAGLDIWADTTFFCQHEGDCLYPIVEPEIKVLNDK